MNYNMKDWKKFYLHGLFDIDMGNKLDMNKMSFDFPSVNFVGRSATNNGVAAIVDKIDNLEPYPAGNITIALGGSIGVTYLQIKPFYTSQNVSVLHSKDSISNYVKLFICTIIKFECRTRYIAFGRELNVHIRKDFELYLPVNQVNKPDWEYMEQIIKKFHYKPVLTKIKSFHVPLAIESWKEFRIDKLFNLSRGRCHNSRELDDGNDIWYIGAKKNENGLMQHVKHCLNLEVNGNCVAFICNGEGSVGFALYQDKNFIPSGDLVIGYNKNLNVYTGLFLVTVLDKERAKYSFGRKWGKYLPNTYIKLPALSKNEPDWQWMEKYIKSLPYSDKI
jgi:hypothetical protein